MKKTFLAIALAATMISCSKDEVVSKHQEAIGFDKTFVNNSTRSVSDPSFSSAEGGNMFDDFAVFGFVEGAVLFDGTQVSKDIENTDLTKTDWKYAGTQYWIAGANYNFNAVAPMTDGGWTKTEATKDATTLSFTNNGTTDLLYAYATQQGAVSNNAAVAFTFRHVLSKVKFSFENAYNATNATIKVKDIQITNPHKTGNVVLNGSSTAWSDNATADDFTLDFGMATDDEATDDAKENVEVAYAYGETYESQKELLLIPSASEFEYNVTFKVDLLISGTSVKEYTHTASVNFTPVAGQSYDIKAVINAKNIDPNNEQEPIEFTVNTLPGWGDTTNDVNIPDNQ